MGLCIVETEYKNLRRGEELCVWKFVKNVSFLSHTKSMVLLKTKIDKFGQKILSLPLLEFMSFCMFLISRL